MNICQNPDCAVRFSPKHNTKGLYCGRSCAATINNKKHPKRSPGKVNCLICEEVLHPANKEACSIECRSRLGEKRFIEKWESDPSFGSTGAGSIKSAARRYLLEQVDYKCSRCKWAEISEFVGHGKPILTVDHIDGNWRNNAIDNLVVLCYNCHTLTPTFGSLNKNSAGRRGTYDRIRGIRA